MKNYNDFAKEVHAVAVDHGWWAPVPSAAECIALMHSELSEALQEYRVTGDDGLRDIWYDGRKPVGFPIEMADCILRILDFCAYHDIDIDRALVDKHEYNKTRPYRHGGKVI